MPDVEKIKNKAIAVQVLATFIASISGISCGMQSGWTAPITPILKAPNSSIPVTDFDVAWFETIIWIGCLVGLPFTIILLNKYGSKVSTLIAAVQNVIAWILIAFGPSVEYIYVSRFITGFASNNSFVSTPIYIAEVADKRIRGFLGTFTYTTMLTGVIAIYSIAPFVSITASSLIGASLLVLQLIAFPCMPDTPYFLLLKGKPEKAREALQWLRASNDINEEMQEISAAIDRQKNEKGRFIDLFKVKTNRTGVIIMTMLNFTQHFSGISVTIMNIHSILEDAVTLSANTAAIIFSALMLLAALCTSTVIDRLGRKFILGCSSFLTGVCLLVIATYFAVKYSGIDTRPYNWILIIAVMMYAISFKCGIGLVPIVMTAEIFPSNIKAMGVTISDAVYVIFAFLSITMYQTLGHICGIHVPFYIFSFCCFSAGFFTVFYIPETKGRTLEEIQMLLNSSKEYPSYGLLHNGNATSTEVHAISSSSS